MTAGSVVSQDVPLVSGQDRQPVQTASISDVYTILATRPEGLSQSEAETRLQRFGPNAIREARRTPWIIRLAVGWRGSCHHCAHATTGHRHLDGQCDQRSF